MQESNWDSYWGEESKSEYWQRPDRAVLELIQRYKPDNQPEVLDLGCGIGRHALAFARSGYKVTAVDSSEKALKMLHKSADKLGLKVETIKANYLDNIFAKESFDIIISYNVLYHGSREDFKKAVELCKGYLKKEGVLFFTCPSRDDGKYGSGPLIAAHTYASLNSVHPGDIHYFSNQEDIIEFTAGLNLINLKKNEHYWENKNKRQFSSYWEVLAHK